LKKLLLFACLTILFFSCRKETNNDPAYLPNGYSDQGLGASAHDLLSADKYTSVSIQVQYMPGYALDPTALSNVTAYLTTLCNKPNGITVTQAQITSGGVDSLTPETVGILEKQNRTAYTTGTTLYLYILVTDGYDTSANTLGFAYRNTSIALFGKNIFTHSGGVGEPTRVSLESNVLEHELGHILGLVNGGSAMVTPHEDTAHSRHCNNTACLMYYAIDLHTTGILHPMTIGTLDSNCRADLRGNGGK
jgi:hypothetical protein